jgi:hypothetical protein
MTAPNPAPPAAPTAVPVCCLCDIPVHAINENTISSAMSFFFIFPLLSSIKESIRKFKAYDATDFGKVYNRRNDAERL